MGNTGVRFVSARAVRHLKPSINYRVHALASSLAKGAMRFYGAKFGITLPEMRILSTLGSYGALAARDIVTLTAMDKALVSRVLSGLATSGYVEKGARRSGPRLRGWHLSPTGEAFVARLQPVWIAREARIQSGLTRAEHEILLDLLERLFWASEKLRVREASVFAVARERSTPRRRTEIVSAKVRQRSRRRPKS